MMNKINFPRVIVLLLLFSMTSLEAQPLQLTDTPLFLNQSVPPALAVTFDDSGSMSWAYMPDSQSFDADKISFTSSDYNQIYYNPDINYTPPMKADGNPMPNASFNDAKPDGFYVAGNLVPRVDLSKNYRPFLDYQPDFLNTSYNLNFAKAGQNNDQNPAFYYTWNGPNNAPRDDAMRDSSNYTKHVISTFAEKRNFANWYSYYNTRAKLSKSAVSLAFSGFGADFKIDWQQINNNLFDNNPNMQVFDGKHRKDFFDWLYGIPSSGGTPLRNATVKAGEIFKLKSVYLDSNSGKELSCQQNFHIAISDGSWNGADTPIGNVDSSTIELPALPDGSIQIYNPNTLPSKMYVGVDKGSLSDIAFEYWSNDLRANSDNNVPVFIEDYTDSNGNIVNIPSNQDWWANNELFWNPKNDPASWQHMVNFNIGLGVQGSLDQNTDLPKLRNGTLQWPSIADVCFDTNQNEIQCEYELCYSNNNNQYSVQNCLLPDNQIVVCYRLNANGTQFFQINCSDRIQSRIFGEINKIDDVWHASVNSRGEYFSAKDPIELSRSLYKIVANIIKRKGRASAGSNSSSIISSSSLTFRTGFDTSDWSGFLIAAPLNTDGSLGSVQWDANCKLTGGLCASMNNTFVSASRNHSTRNIFTYDKVTNTQHPFHTVEMSTTETARILNSDYYKNVAINNSVTLDDFIHYIRGDKLLENQNGGNFRDRKSLLGDIIHAKAEIIRGPSASYDDNLWGASSPERLAADLGNGYTEFKNTNKDRKSVVLAGANDGMLHAFDTGLESIISGGDELWAYIPYASLDGISELANPQYNHKSFVDASPYVRDAYINGQWSTVVLGSLRKGGKSYYALDMGNKPSLEPKVLWEFSDLDEPDDMGYSYGRGLITRVVNQSSTADSKWIALIPNGYNSNNQQSVLYAVDMATGNLLHKWNYNVGNLQNPNGMGPPAAADFVNYDGNPLNPKYESDLGTDYAYAGDLAGNVYRFDMQKIFTSTLSSKPELLFSGNRNQAITTAPRILTPEDGTENVIVAFGTGKYLELGDRVAKPLNQYVVGLKDSRQMVTTYNINDTRLVEQFISTNLDKRTLTSKSVNTTQSWKIKLPVSGERIVSFLGRNNNEKLLTIASIIPNAGDPCLSGGKSWVMIIDGKSGGAPSQGSFFDFGNSDGFLVNDLVLGFNYLTLPGGGQSFLNLDLSGSGITGSGTQITLNRTSRWSRRSWHRIIIE